MFHQYHNLLFTSTTPNTQHPTHSHQTQVLLPTLWKKEKKHHPKTMLPTQQRSATAYPRHRRGAISVHDGQTFGDYYLQQQQPQEEQATRILNGTDWVANAQPEEQQAVAGAEAPEEYWT